MNLHYNATVFIRKKYFISYLTDQPTALANLCRSITQGNLKAGGTASATITPQMIGGSDEIVHWSVFTRANNSYTMSSSGYFVLPSLN